MTGTDEATLSRKGDRRISRFRTVLAVPMVKDDNLIGCINIYRQEVRPFTDKQIELVQIHQSRPGVLGNRNYEGRKKCTRQSSNGQFL